MNSKESRIFHIGIDDTDSSDGMCTTFLTYNLVNFLSHYSNKLHLIDYPNLIRLNPNIPWKTRGNAALAIRIETTVSESELFRICKDHVDRFATSARANAGLVIYEGNKIPMVVQDFSKRALFSVLSVKEAKSIVEHAGILSHSLRSQQGLVGALAAIGNGLERDFTFELIAYRRSLRFRRIDNERVKQMHNATIPLTFNSYDNKNDRVLIAPHGPDPVLLGIRGETPKAVKRAFELIQPLENLLGYMIFRSNQGTGEHLQNSLDLSELKSYYSGKVIGKIISRPKAQIGGHVFFELANERGRIICACYEPTGKLRNCALSLVEGDLIEVAGGIRKSTSKHPKVLNVEYIRPLSLVEHVLFHNPRCPYCNISLSSQGRGQGFQCEKCKSWSSSNSKESEVIEREVIAGQMYLPDMKAHRHLSKPLQRLDLRSRDISRKVPLIKNWIRTE
jgi:tRNA(Ile2)-agmatinylcytidine synthase